jgi:hypothetical protein
MVGNSNSFFIRESFIDEQQLLEFMLPDGVDAGLELIPIEVEVPCLKPLNNFFSELGVNPVCAIIPQDLGEVEHNLLNEHVFSILLHCHHIFDSELFLFLYSFSDYLLQARGTAVGDFMDTGAMHVVITCKFVISHCDITSFGVSQTWFLLLS